MNTTDPYFNLGVALGVTRQQVIDAAARVGVSVIVKEVERGDGRKAHYGAGKQPIDTIMELGWGPGFCAGNVLKYLRRTKAPEHSAESARVYWKWLDDLATKGTSFQAIGVALLVGRQLTRELTAEELSVLTQAEIK